MPQLITKLLSSGFNIVYLPRLSEDTFLIKSFLASKQFFIPESPLNGLDLCYYSRGVLSGSGTLTREAACLGKTAVSFLPSETLLSVDQSLINHNKLYHSRDIQDITNYILKSNSNSIDVNQEIEKSKILRDKFLSTLFQLFGKLNDD